MPVKLGLVMMNRQPINIQPQKPIQPSIQITDAPSQQQKGLTLRRVMNAPKTGCKSCGG